uniref:Uncharacterized protein n=1 Tax=Anguilla anguilla TaxID=7936 RepID=A0A0E9SJQ6_ANGAN
MAKKLLILSLAKINFFVVERNHRHLFVLVHLKPP